MKGSGLAVLLGFTLAATSRGQVVQWDIEKRDNGKELSRRAESAIEASVANEASSGGYFATVKIGTPGQKVSLQLDTGSSDVWVPATQAEICVKKTQLNPGCTYGSFNPDKSSTFDNVGPNAFDITYADESYSRGDYFQDDFQIGSVTVENLTMGLGKKSTLPYGLIGVGYASNEASIGTSNTVYPNLPVAMQQSGMIKTVAYSLWLNDLDANKGSILFGGIDTEKYVGNLTKLKIIAGEDNVFNDLSVHLFSVEASSSSGTDTLMTEVSSIEAVLDSGTTLTYLPTDMAEQAWQEVGAVYDSDRQLAVLPCSFGNNAGYFSFLFAGSQGPRINVTMDELVVDLTSGRQPTFGAGLYEGESVCSFGIQNQTSSPYLLGDTFLRSAYVVYDLINNEIGIAATDFNSTGSNVVAFESKGAAIPSATAAPSQDGTSGAPQPTQTGLTATKGFQDEKKGGSKGGEESSAPLLSRLSWPGLLTVIISVGYTLLHEQLM